MSKFDDGYKTFREFWQWQNDFAPFSIAESRKYWAVLLQDCNVPMKMGFIDITCPSESTSNQIIIPESFVKRMQKLKEARSAEGEPRAKAIRSQILKDSPDDKEGAAEPQDGRAPKEDVAASEVDTVAPEHERQSTAAEVASV